MKHLKKTIEWEQFYTLGICKVMDFDYYQELVHFINVSWKSNILSPQTQFWIEYNYLQYIHQKRKNILFIEGYQKGWLDKKFGWT